MYALHQHQQQAHSKFEKIYSLYEKLGRFSLAFKSLHWYIRRSRSSLCAMWDASKEKYALLALFQYAWHAEFGTEGCLLWRDFNTTTTLLSYMIALTLWRWCFDHGPKDTYEWFCECTPQNTKTTPSLLIHHYHRISHITVYILKESCFDRVRVFAIKSSVRIRNRKKLSF